MAQPPTFESYVLTRETSADTGLSNVADSKFMRAAGLAGRPNEDDNVGLVSPVGFDFTFDGLTYNRYLCSPNGWLALVDPSADWNPVNVTNALFQSGSMKNEGINLSNATKHVLLAPWFDDLRNVSDTLDVASPFVYGATKKIRVAQGFEPPPLILQPQSAGVKTFFDPRGPLGRRLIVRWLSLSDYANASTVIKFEVVLNENGVIEFRYAPKKSFAVTATKWGPGPDDFIEDATVGIFAGPNRFRDFALGLGRSDQHRSRYIYGGATYDPNFSDAGFESTLPRGIVSRPYVWRLVPAIHWPGLDAQGTAFVFTPPREKRKILPRLELRKRDSRLTLPTVARTGDERPGNAVSTFDDRRAVAFVPNVVVSYPTTLQRFSGDSEPSVTARQDLFSGDFLVTGSITKAGAEQFLGGTARKTIAPFNENKVFDNDPSATTDAFFTSGSSLSQLGFGLQQPLRAKTQVRFSLPVDYVTTMMGASSSIYFYNGRSRAWNVPQNSSYTLTNVGSTSPPVGNTKGDIADVAAQVRMNIIPEDARGFGPIGNFVASGSRTIARDTQSDALISASYSSQMLALALDKQYAKTMTNNPDYRATNDEVFSLPINHPFLIERAVIEIPLTAGDGWFADKTTAFLPWDSSGSLRPFDFGGPALTIGLFNQTVAGETCVSELIMSGTITHQFDDVDQLCVSRDPTNKDPQSYAYAKSGFRAYGTKAGAIVYPQSLGSNGYIFTGSVVVHCEAQVSNGPILQYEWHASGVEGHPNEVPDAVIDFLNTEEISLADFFSSFDGGSPGPDATRFSEQSVKLAYLNNFGRSARGFQSSGRSVYGKEFNTTQTVNLKNNRIKNPFNLSTFVGYKLTRDNIVDALTANNMADIIPTILSSDNVTMTTAISLEAPLPSPYLVYPSDKFVLSVSKTRPFAFLTSGSFSPDVTTDTSNSQYTSGSKLHDVALSSGSINIVLYGSLLRDGVEFHDTINQPLASDAVHEMVVGNEPVLDQFEVEFRQEHSGSFDDDVIMGSLVTKLNGVLTTGPRGRIFSMTNPAAIKAPGTSMFDSTTSSSLSYLAQPFSEKAGIIKNTQHVSTTERYWDSMMPAINECFAADGAGIFFSNFFSGSITMAGQPEFMPMVFFDSSLDRQFSKWSGLIDNKWTKAYPFEPRYDGIQRHQRVEKTFVANRVAQFNSFEANFNTGDFNSMLSSSYVASQAVNGFFLGTWGNKNTGTPNPNPSTSVATTPTGSVSYHAVGDGQHAIFGAVFFATTPSSTDVIKTAFGFGDLNTTLVTNLPNAPGTRFGTNHFADCRRSERANQFGQYDVSPIIRGWKYGVYSGLPAFSRAYFRRGRYGQVRDMLEQRQYTKFYTSDEPGFIGFLGGQTEGIVNVKFIDPLTGNVTSPQNTQSSNLSFECTSSLPYDDGRARNRTPFTVPQPEQLVVNIQF